MVLTDYAYSSAMVQFLDTRDTGELPVASAVTVTVTKPSTEAKSLVLRGGDLFS